MPCRYNTNNQLPVIFLPGWGFSAHVFASLAQTLGNDYPVLLHELPGFLPSDDEALPGCINEVIKRLSMSFPERAHYVGWSLGGLLLQAFAQEYPTRVQSLTVIGSSPRFLADANWPGVTMDFFAQFQQRLKQDHAATLRYFALLMLSTREYQRKQIHDILSLMSPDSEILLESLINGLCLLKDTDLRLAMTHHSVPIQWLRGSHDPLCPNNEKIPFIEIEHAHHAPWLSHLEQTRQYITGFLHAHT